MRSSGVWRPWLRDAIQKLLVKGLLSTRHGSGTLVTDRLAAQPHAADRGAETLARPLERQKAVSLLMEAPALILPPLQLSTTLLRRRRYVATTGSTGGICPSATLTGAGSMMSRIAI